MNLLFKKSWTLLYFIPFIGGLLYAAGFPMNIAPKFFPLSLIGVGLLLNALIVNQKLNLKWTQKVLSVLSFSLGYCWLGYYWIPYTLKEFGEIYFPFNYLLGSLFSLIIAPHFIFFALILHFLDKKILTKEYLWPLKNLSYAFFLTFLESFIPQQFPGHLGHSWLQIAPYLGLAPYFGVPLFSFASYSIIFTILSKIKRNSWDWLGLSFFSLFIIINIINPLRAPYNEQTSQVAQTRLRLVQANIGNLLKLQSEDGSPIALSQVTERYKELSLKNKETKIDLLIWPETAFPMVMNSVLLKTNPIATPYELTSIASELDSQFIIGGYDKALSHDKNYFETEYNSVFYFDRLGRYKDVYHKHVLIPFGESLPFGPLNRYLSNIIDNISFFAAGDRFPLFKLDNGVTMVNAVCYEVLFSYFIRDYLQSVNQRPHFILNITNDSWYGDTAEPYQHQYLAHWRALEFQLPIVRMTNTGLTSILYTDGSQSRDLGINKKGVLDISLFTKKEKKTFYQSIGFSGVFGIWVLLITLWFLILKKKAPLLKDHEDEENL